MKKEYEVNMKKYLKCFKIFTALIISTALLSACNAANNNNNTPGIENGTKQDQTKVEYKEGTYTGTGDKWQYGNEDATVVISDGKIKSINLRRLDLSGNEVNYDNYAGQEVDGKVYPNLKQYRLDLADKMIEKQTYDVDSISGATVSCENWKLAVKRALEKAKK